MTSSTLDDLRVALVHDDLTQRGGAERVVLSLHRLFPHAPIFTTVFDADGTYPEFHDLDVRTTFLQRFPHRGNAARALLPLYPAAVSRIDLRGYDLVVSSSSRFAHGVRVPDGVHVTYCHNPPRFLHQTDEYFAAGAPVPAWSRRALAPLLGSLRRWDREASTRPDLYVANSRVTAGRIARAYGRRSEVIHPPVELGRFTAAEPAPDTPIPDEPYYLAVARLLSYKRIDLAAGACRRLGRRLVVVGAGPAAARVREAGGPNVEIRSRVTDPELVALLRECTALLQPGVEDFGLAPLEANAAGRPVVAFGEGGALETVLRGTTGLVFHDQSVEAVSDAMTRVEEQEWDPSVLRRHAASFGEAAFHARLRDRLEAALIAQGESERTSAI